MTARHGEKDRKQWSARVTRDSHALELEAGVVDRPVAHFVGVGRMDHLALADDEKRHAEASTARKAPPFRSAMSMLVFYINRAGTHLDEEQKRILEQAKDELRRLYTDD